MSRRYNLPFDFDQYSIVVVMVAEASSIQCPQETDGDKTLVVAVRGKI